MERNVRLIIAYDGTHFHGWQTQRGVRTVQKTLEDLIARVVKHPVALAAASRTDSGVHARGQSANFVTNTPMPTENLRSALAHRLPPDVMLVHAEDVKPEFHSTRHAIGKLYRYRLLITPAEDHDPFATRFAWHVWYRLDVDALRAAAAAIIGTHDFAGFATQGSQRATTVRTVSRCAVRRVWNELWIDVGGDGFLYNQVRNMVGTLVEIARGHWPVERIAKILEVCDRSLAGPTAPPQGLCLQWVEYPKSVADRGTCVE